MPPESESSVLRRYTDIPSLLYLLRSRTITFLDPSSWDDTNDSYYLLKYKEKKKLGAVLVLCFTQTEETYHHWRVFADSASGVCIMFDRSTLLHTFSGLRGILKGPVDYQRVRDAKRRSVPLSVDELPFIKRAGYMPEAEYRVVYTSRDPTVKFRDVSIPLNSIFEIRLSPWLNSRLRRCVRETIQGISGCKDLSVHRSTLIGNRTWKELGDSAT